MSEKKVFYYIPIPHMKKRPNLAEVAAAGSTRSKTTPPEPAQKSTEPPRARTRSARTKQIAGHFPEEVSWQLRELAVERRATVQALLGEALNDLFQKHGKPEIACPFHLFHRVSQRRLGSPARTSF